PGLIGFIGTIFGKHQVNIAQMTVGRAAPGGEAIAVLNLDNLPPEEALKEVRSHPQISSVSVVKLPRAGELPPWFGGEQKCKEDLAQRRKVAKEEERGEGKGCSCRHRPFLFLASFASLRLCVRSSLHTGAAIGQHSSSSHFSRAFWTCMRLPACW